MPVHHDPDDPATSGLELRDLTWTARLLVPMMLVALGIGAYCAWEGFTGCTPSLRRLRRR